MKKIIILLAFLIPVLLKAQKMQDLKKYKPEMEISLIGGFQKFKNPDAASAVYGVEVSLQCPLVQSQKAYIRQHFKFTHQQAQKISSTTIEINPQCVILDRSNIKLGIGPGAGLIFANIAEDHKTIFSYGLGTSSAYYFKKISIGIGACYAMTNKVSYANSKYESAGTARLNNWSSFLKLGYKF